VSDVVVPERPVLVQIPAVELIHTGFWQISTGPWEVTSDDLYAAVAALECPAVRRPVLKLGHVDPRFDGEPAVGWVDNLAVSASGTELVGDYCGLPAWLGDVLASAYPDRSIEGYYDWRCQIGHVHPFYLDAVALLGVERPGVGTLESLQDIAALYGVAAATDTTTAGAFRVRVNAKGSPMTRPASPAVSASATVEEVRRSFYDGPAANNWWWIEALYVDPLEVIAIDDADGVLWRLPFTVADDGEITWGEAQQVRREYVAASTGLRAPMASWATRAESRPAAPRASTDPTGPPAGTTEEDTVPDIIDEVRTRLGLPADADDSTVLEALNERLPAEQPTTDPAPVAPPAAPAPVPQTDGTVTVDAATWSQLQASAQRGEEARARQEQDDRVALVSAAVADGRIPPARRDHWLSLLAADPGAATTLAGLAKGVLPVSEIGHGGNPAASATGSTDDLGWFASVTPANPTNKQGV
jgi:hypothetical protein